MYNLILMNNLGIKTIGIIGNIVNDVVITMSGVRWVLDLLG